MKLIHTHRFFGAALLSSVLLFGLAAKSQATGLTYYVTLNVASLIGNSNAPFSLDVELTNGATNPDSDNTVTLSNFVFSGGSVGTENFESGGESGSMSSTVTLTNNSFDNELSQPFTLGVTQISFEVSETNVSDNPDPDQFEVSLYDNNSNQVPTMDPNSSFGSNTLVDATLSTGETIANSVVTYNGANSTEGQGVTSYAGTSVIPEPAPVASLLLGLLGIGLFARRGFRRSARA